MLTTAAELREHLRIKRREARADRLTGHEPKSWPTPNYVRMLEIRLARMEGTEDGTAPRKIKERTP